MHCGRRTMCELVLVISCLVGWLDGRNKGLWEVDWSLGEGAGQLAGGQEERIVSGGPITVQESRLASGERKD